MKLAGDPSNALRIKDDATVVGPRDEIMRRLAALVDGGVVDLKAVPMRTFLAS
jgi:hypothetical protein